MERSGNKHWRRPAWVALHSILLYLAPITNSHAAHLDTATAAIGVLAFRGADVAAEEWKPLVDHLNKSVDGHHFTLVPLTLDDIKHRVESKQLDFVITSAASFAMLEEEYGVSQIATVRWQKNGVAYAHFSSVIFSRRDNEAIQHLEDLKGRRFMAVHPDAFGGWWTAWRELRQHGVQVEDLAKLSYSGFPQDDVVYAVREGVADAGTVRAGVLEALAAKGQIKLDDFRILNAQPLDEYPFAHSTRLYPELTFAMLQSTHQELARKVLVALLNAPETPVKSIAGEAISMTIPVDQKPVLELMKELRVGLYKDLHPLTAKEVLLEYRWYIAAGALLTLILAGFTLFIGHLNRRLLEARQAAENQTLRLQTLYRISALPGTSWQDQLTEVLKTGCALLNADSGLIWQVNTITDVSILLNAVGEQTIPVAKLARVPLTSNVTGAIASERKPVAISAVDAALWQTYGDSPCKGSGALIGTYVLVLGRPFGTLEFYAKQARRTRFTRGDEELLQLIAHWAGVALERYFATRREARSSAHQESGNASDIATDIAADIIDRVS